MDSNGRSAARPHYYGAADFNLLVVWRSAPHNHAEKADIGRQIFGFSALAAYPPPRYSPQ